MSTENYLTKIKDRIQRLYERRDTLKYDLEVIAKLRDVKWEEMTSLREKIKYRPKKTKDEKDSEEEEEEEYEEYEVSELEIINEKLKDICERYINELTELNKIFAFLENHEIFQAISILEKLMLFE